MSPTCPSRPELDQFLHEELSEGRRRELAEHLLGCPGCQAWVAAAEEHAADYRQKVDSLAFARQVVSQYSATREREERPSTFWSWLRRPATLTAAAAACVLLLVVAIWRGGPADPTRVVAPEQPGGSRIKGVTSVRLHCNRGDKVFVLQPDHRVAAGDAIRFEVYGGDAGYLLVLGLQRDGLISTYLPFDGKQSLPIATRRTVTAPGSIVLDDSTTDELLVVLLSRGPLRAAGARAALREAFERAGGDLDAVDRLSLGLPVAGQHIRLLKRKRN